MADINELYGLLKQADAAAQAGDANAIADVQALLGEIDRIQAAPTQAQAIPVEDPTRLQTPLGNEPGMLEQATAAVAPMFRGAFPVAATAAAGVLGAAALGAPVATGLAAAGLTTMLGDPIVAGVNKLFGTRLTTPTEAWTHLMDKLEIPVSSTEGAKLVEAISRGGASALSSIGAGAVLQQMSSPAAKAIGNALASGPTEQVVGGMAAGGGGEAARYGAERAGFGETGQAVAEAAGSLIGGIAGAKMAQPRRLVAAAPEVPGMTPAQIQATVAEAEAAGRPVFTSDVFRPETEATRRLQDFSEGTVLGTAAQRSAQQNIRNEYINNVLQEFGAAPTAEFSEQIAKNLKDFRADRIQYFSGMKNEVLDRISLNSAPLQSPELSRVFTTLTEEIDALNKTNRTVNAPIVAKLKQFGEGLLGDPIIDPATGAISGYSGISLQAAEKNLGLIRPYLANDQSLAHVKTSLEKTGNKLYGALKEDIKGVIRNAEGAESVSRYEQANARLAEGIKQTKSAALKAALRSGDVAPETVERMLFSQKPSEIRLLYSNLDSQGRAAARSAILSKAARESIIQSTGEISTAKFSTQLGKLSKQTGVFFGPEDKKVVDGLANYLNLTKRAENFNVDPKTGARVLMPLGVSMVVNALGGPKAVGVMMSFGGMSRVFESAPTRKLLMALPRIKNNSDEQFSMLKRINESISADMANHEAERSRNKQITFLPENLQVERLPGRDILTDSSTGYRISSKDGTKFALYAPNNELIGVFTSQEKAQQRADKEQRKRK